MVPTQGRENLGEKLLPPESESQFYLDQSLWTESQEPADRSVRI